MRHKLAAALPALFWTSSALAQGPQEQGIDTVINEDFAAMAGVQRGLASGVLDHVRVGANEPALGLFHAALGDALADRSARTPAPS